MRPRSLDEVLGQAAVVGPAAFLRAALAEDRVATDADLSAAVTSGRFRAPLFFRLAAQELWVPPLRKRREDIGPLLYAFLAAELKALELERLLEPDLTEPQLWMPAALVARLARCPWPGNVRQLRSLVGVMAGNAAHAPALSLDDPRWPRPSEDADPVGGGPVETPATSSVQKPKAPRDIDELELEQALEAHDFRLAAVANHFGISRPSLNGLIDRHPRLRRARHLEALEIASAMAAEAAGGPPAWRALRVSETGLRRGMQQLGLS
jgi:two-component system nitrogen regulation response regulator GlnG